MPTAAAVADSLSILQEACDRNVPVDMHYVNPDMGRDGLEPDMLYAQSRLLGVDERKVYLDSPQQIGKRVHLREGRQVEVYFTLREKNYAFRSVVRQLQCKVALNRQKKVVGMSVALPGRVKEGQRREDHRVSVAAFEVINADMHEAGAADPNTCPVEAVRMVVRVVNLSRGGAAVRVGRQDARRLRIGGLYYICFELPGDGSEMIFLTEVRHTADILQGAAQRVGLQFLQWPDPRTMRRQIGKLGRFLAAAERRLLQNQRTR